MSEQLEAALFATRRLRQAGERMSTLMFEVQGLMMDAATDVRTILEVEPREAKAIAHIGERLQRCAELRNMMELGSLNIEIGRATQEVWRELNR